MSTPPASGLPVPPGLQRGNHRERQEWIDSGLFVVGVLERTVGRDDLAGVDVLDVGCGTKIVKTILDNGMDVGSYTGIDIHAPVIEFLTENVSDPRFEFHHFPALNELYNPDGAPLSEFEHLPAPLEAFDLICLFSVFTHLDPTDYVLMLKLLRRHVRPDGRLVFSLFLNDPDHPSPFAIALEEALRSDDPAVVANAEAAIAQAQAAKVDGYIDEIPDRPLMQARYDKEYALSLVEGTGWAIERLDPPGQYIQHSLVCRPI